jgi:hypothetical protein
LWPEVECPFAVVAKFAVETLPDGTPSKVGERGDPRTDYQYLMSLQVRVFIHRIGLLG